MEFDRFKLLVGDKYSKIKSLKILVLGVGGVGGYVVESLARCGVGDITIVDSDIVDVTNINRQIIALHSTIGRKKVEVLKERILEINKNCKVTPMDLFYEAETKEFLFTKDYDYVVDCCDTIKSKEILIRQCMDRKIKIISSMGAGFKLDPSKIKIDKLKNTSYDKIAKILRTNLKNRKDCLEIPVVFSTEMMQKKGTVIASNSYIPAIFGLFITSYIIKDVLEEK